MFDDGIENVLVAQGTRIRVLNIEDHIVLGIGLWRELYGACTNLEAVRLSMYGFAVDIDVLTLMRAKLVSVKINCRLTRVQCLFFSVLSRCSVLKTVELQLWKIGSESLGKLCACLKSVATMTEVCHRFSQERYRRCYSPEFSQPRIFHYLDV